MAIKTMVRRNYQEEVTTIQDAFKEFINEKQCKNLTPSSIRCYEKTFQFFMNFFEFDEHTPIQEVNNNLFKQWAMSLIDDGLKPTSINKYMRDCKVFCNWCIEAGYLNNPIKIEMMKVQEAAVKSFPEEDLIAITAKPNNPNDFVEWRTWAIIQWVLATGNRASTVCNVHIGDIDFRNREIVLSHTKNKKAQIIPLSRTLEAIIKDYMKTWRYGADSDDYLFPNIGNDFLTPEALTHSFAKYCKARGSSHTNIHGLRHSFALNWIRNGGNQFKLQKILGHSTLDMTLRYVNLVTDDLKDGYDDFSTFDFKRNKKPVKTIVRA